MAKKGKPRIDKRNPAHATYEQRVVISKPEPKPEPQPEQPNSTSSWNINHADSQEKVRVTGPEVNWTYSTSHVVTQSLEILERLEGERVKQTRRTQRAIKLMVQKFGVQFYSSFTGDYVISSMSCDLCGKDFDVKIMVDDALEENFEMSLKRFTCSESCYIDLLASMDAGEQYVHQSLGVQE